VAISLTDALTFRVTSSVKPAKNAGSDAIKRYIIILLFGRRISKKVLAAKPKNRPNPPILGVSFL